MFNSLNAPGAMAVTLAAARMSPGLIDALRGPLREWEVLRLTTSPETMDREAQMNQTFHFAIYRACGSDVLLPMIESLWLQSGPYVRAAVLKFDPKSEISALHYHREILAALKARDAEAAKRALASDISRAFDLLRDTPLTDSEPAPPAKRRYRRKT